MGGLDRRIIKPEILDTLPEEQGRRSLDDLRKINRWLGGHAIARGVFRALTAPRDRFTVLDVGAASSGMGEAVRRVRPGARFVAMDLKIDHLGEGGPRLVADAFQLPFGARSFDFVFCSLFLHHFPDREAAGLLRELGELARRAVVVIDLERSGFAAGFLPRTRWLFGWDPVSALDGRVSVRAAFRKEELERLARAAGLDVVRVRRHWPWCRLSLVARRR